MITAFAANNSLTSALTSARVEEITPKSEAVATSAKAASNASTAVLIAAISVPRVNSKPFTVFCSAVI